MIPATSGATRVILAGAGWKTGGLLPTQRRLQLSVQESDRTQWCWAAVGLGVRQAYGTVGAAVEQCEVATEVLEKKHPAIECCPKGNGCNTPWEVPPALKQHYVMTRSSKKHRTFSFVQGHIDADHPVVVRIARRKSRSGHFVVISGYVQTVSGVKLWICDPEFGTRQAWLFDQFRDNYDQDGFWDESYETNTGTVPPE